MARTYFRKDRRKIKVWYIDYMAADPETGEIKRKRERVGYSRSEAEEALQSRLTDIRRGKFDRIFPETSHTLLEIRDQYLKFAQTVKSPQTVERDDGILDKLLTPRFGKTSLNKITIAQVEDYRSARLADGIAPATINKEVQLLKHIVKKAVEWGKIRTNLIVGIKPLKTPPGRIRYLELEQIPRLMKACPTWLRPIVLIDMNTGMRRGEILGLQKHNIDKKNRLIIIEKTKNNERKTIPMNNTVFGVMNSLVPRIDTLYLFADEKGQPLSPNKVSMAFKRASRKAEIRDFCLHDLRHHFASYLTMSGQNQRVVQELLGHKDPKMTMRYSHLSQKHLREAVKSLDNLSGRTEEAKRTEG